MIITGCCSVPWVPERQRRLLLRHFVFLYNHIKTFPVLLPLGNKKGKTIQGRAGCCGWLGRAERLVRHNEGLSLTPAPAARPGHQAGAEEERMAGRGRNARQEPVPLGMDPADPSCSKQGSLGCWDPPPESPGSCPETLLNSSHGPSSKVSQFQPWDPLHESPNSIPGTPS